MVATITLSIEVELAWGFHDRTTSFPHLSRDRRVETETLEKLLAVCDEREIPVSFDVVGYLLHESYEPLVESPHGPEWLPVGPDSDRDSDPLFFAPDMVEAIIDRQVEHEVCTHTYTHTPLGEVPEETVTWEIERARQAHRSFGLPRPRSLVPPRHSLPPAAVVRETGIETVRTPATSRPATRPREFLHYLSRSHPVREPERIDEIVETYSSMSPSLTAPSLQSGQRPPHPAFRAIPRAIRERVHRRYLERSLDRAVERDTYAHFWTHLFDAANDVQWPLVREFLETLADRRDGGDVEFAPMERLPGGIPDP